jgi:hypothetical protein
MKTAEWNGVDSVGWLRTGTHCRRPLPEGMRKKELRIVDVDYEDEVILTKPTKWMTDRREIRSFLLRWSPSRRNMSATHNALCFVEELEFAHPAIVAAKLGEN